MEVAVPAVRLFADSDEGVVGPVLVSGVSPAPGVGATNPGDGGVDSPDGVGAALVAAGAEVDGAGLDGLCVVGL